MKPIFAVKDRAINGYANLFCDHSTQTALRAFRDEINSDPTRSAVAKHPDDYDLYILGEYDQDTGAILAQPPELLARGKDLLNPGE